MTTRPSIRPRSRRTTPTRALDTPSSQDDAAGLAPATERPEARWAAAISTSAPAHAPAATRGAVRPEDRPVLEMRGVGRRYGDVQALRDMDLIVRRGEVVALLGPNGAGKTTAVSLLLGLIRPHGGTVRTLGGDPRAAAVRMRIGAMMQVSGIPQTLTVREHLEAFASYYPRPMEVAEALAGAGLGEVAGRLYGDLSGGQQQRLHLALALIGDPDLLFLDEPTTGLDVAARRGLWDRVRAFLADGRTVVLTTHYLEEADALADRIVLMDRGEVLVQGTPEQIKRRAAARRVRAVTALAPTELAALPGVADVRRDGAATVVLAAEAEPVVREMLRRDPDLSGLEVGGAGLEEAFLALTGRGGEAAA